MSGSRFASSARALLVTLVLLAVAMLAGGMLPGTDVAYGDTVGFNAPGATNYSNLAPIVTGSTQLHAGLDWARASAIDSANGFLYMGMATQPGVIAKLRLSDFTVVDTLELRQGEDLPGVTLIDPIHGYLYIGTYTAPAQVIKVRLSDFSRVDALTFEPGENCSLYNGLIDPAGGAAYFGLDSGHIVKVNLADFTRVGSLRDPNCPRIETAVLDTAGGYAYFGSLAVPGTVVRVRLSDFTLAGELPMSGGEGGFAAAAVDPAGGYAYFGTADAPNAGRIVRIRLSDFTHVGTLTLSGYRECGLNSAVIDPSHGYLYMGTAFGAEPGKVIRVNLSTFSEAGTLTLPNDNPQLLTAALDPGTGMAYFGSGTCGARVAKIQLSTLSLVKSLSLPGGDSRAYGCAVDRVGGFGYFPLNTQPAKMAKVRLSDMTEVSSATLGAGENLGFGVVLSPAGDSVYMGLDSHPGEIVKFRTSDMARVASLSPSYLGAVWCGVTDPSGAYAYFGTYSPGQIVKVDLATFSVVDSMDLLPDEYNLDTAAIDPTGTYAYFGTWDNGYAAQGIVIKVRLSDFTRVSRAVTSGLKIQALGLDATGTYAYTGSFDSPAIVSKIRLSDMTVVRTVTLDPGENDLRGCVVDSASGYAQFSIGTVPGRLVRVRLSDLSHVDETPIDASVVVRYAVGPGITPGSIIAATCSQPSLVARAESNPRDRLLFSKVSLATGARVNDLQIYSYESTGTLYLSLYSDGETRHLLWRSEPVVNVVQDGWITVPVGAGEPSALTLSPGDYWLGFQTDVPNSVAGCTTATAPSDGCEFRQPFRVPPSVVTAPHTYANQLVWSEFMTYDVVTQDVATPVNVAPPTSATNVALATLLSASDFSDAFADRTHAASQWQVRAATTAGDYSEVVFDSEATTSALTACAVPDGILAYATDYDWHVRYQDSAGSWSPWSVETVFTTLPSPDGPNRPPLQPVNVEPGVEQQGVSTTPRLVVSDFADPDAGDTQTASRWRLRSETGTYAPALYDSGEVLSSTPTFDVPWTVLTNGNRYFWQACVCDSHGAWSPWSDETPFHTVSSDSLPTPVGLRSAPGVDSVWLTWVLSPDSSVRGYYLLRSRSYAGPWTTVVSGDVIRGDQWLDAGLTPQTTYYYRIASVKLDGTVGELSPVVSATVGSTRLFMNEARGLPGQTTTQMVTIDNANNIANNALQIEIAFDPAKVTPVAVSTTALTDGFELQTNVTNGVLTVMGLGSGLAIQGEGNVLQVDYQVQAGAQPYDRTLLSFPAAELWDDSVPPNPVGVDHSSTATLTVAAPVVLGDVNDSGHVTVGDVLLLRQIVAGLVSPTPRMFEAADINGDHVLDSADVVLALRLSLGGALPGTRAQNALPPFLARSAQAPAVTSHHLSWGAATFGSGTIDVPLCIDQLDGVAGLDVVINYDTQKLAFDFVDQGAALANYQSWQSNADYEVNDQTGQIRLTVARSTMPVAGSGQVAVLHFVPRGSYWGARLVVAKFLASGINGESLARTRTLVADDDVLSQTPLAAPAAISASDGAFRDHVHVSWSSVPSAAKYQVWRSTEATGTLAAAVSLWQTGLTFNDTSAVAGVTYYYWVRAALDASGTSASGLGGPDTGWSSSLTAPTNVVASDASFADHVHVTWDAVPLAADYQVLRSDTPTSSSAVVVSGWQPDLAYDDSSAVPGVTYYYWVQAGADATGAGAGFLGGPDAGSRPALLAPGNVHASDGAFPDRIQVTWDGVAQASNYQVWRSTSSDSASAVIVLAWQAGLSFDDTAALPGVTYYYWVGAAIDAAGTGAGPWGGPDAGSRPALGTPTGVAASKGSFNDKVRVTWDEIDGAAFYQVWRAPQPDVASASAVCPWQGDPVYDDLTATAGITYYYWVRAAADASGGGATALGGPDYGWRSTTPVTGRYPYKVTCKNCTPVTSGTLLLGVANASSKASVKIQRLKTPPAGPSTVAGVVYLLDSPGLDSFVVTGDLATFYSDAPVGLLQATGSLGKVSTRDACIGRVEAGGRIASVKMAELANAFGASPTYAATSIVSGGSPDDTVSVTVTGMILETLATSQTVQSASAASKAWTDRVSGASCLSLSGIGRVTVPAIAAWPSGAYGLRAAAFGKISAKSATVAPDRLTATGPIGSIRAKPRRPPGFECGTVGQPSLGATALFVAASGIGSVTGGAGVSGTFLAGYNPANDGATHTGTIGKIAVAKGAGSIAGEAFVQDGTALREALASYGAAAAGFTVWDQAQPKPQSSSR